MKKTFYVFNEGEFKRKDNTLFFESEQGRRYIPVEDVQEIHIFSEVNLNKRFLEFLTQKEVILHFYNYYGYYVGTYYPREHLNSGYMILRQVEHYLDWERRLKLARAFVEGAAANMIEVLTYYNRRNKDVQDPLNSIVELLERIEDNMRIEGLMAIEGNIRNAYYSAFNTIIDKSEFCFEGRNRRPPRDRINGKGSIDPVYRVTLPREINRFFNQLDPLDDTWLGSCHENKAGIPILCDEFQGFTQSLPILDGDGLGFIHHNYGPAQAVKAHGVVSSRRIYHFPQLG